MSRIPVIILSAVLLSAAMTARADAQAAGTALRVSIDSEINFGTAALDGRGGGAIELDPVTGQRRATGGLVIVGGAWFTGRASISGRPLSRVRVILPTSITMRARRGVKAVAASFTASIPPVVTLDANGRYSFAFAGTFKADETDSGEFRGNFAITADYE